MSKRVKAILVLLISLVLLPGCQETMIPTGYLPGPNKVYKGITGSWIILSVIGDTITGFKAELSGELIAVQSDSLYVLTEAGLQVLNKKNINSAVLYLFAPQGAVGPFISLMLFIPNIIGAISSPEFAGSFLGIGIPLLVTGITEGIIETGGNSKLKYPGRYLLEDFVKYARYPQGFPPALNREQFHIVNRDKI
ncbi:MAG: hypothetical protein MUC93_02645 [Bacteroidales bacterium]|jgi:hypothetical protein|nr:hypothetical protein [Bacteroidales bacterium]